MMSDFSTGQPVRYVGTNFVIEDPVRKTGYFEIQDITGAVQRHQMVGDYGFASVRYKIPFPIKKEMFESVQSMLTKELHNAVILTTELEACEKLLIQFDITNVPDSILPVTNEDLKVSISASLFDMNTEAMDYDSDDVIVGQSAFLSDILHKRREKFLMWLGAVTIMTIITIFAVIAAAVL